MTLFLIFPTAIYAIYPSDSYANHAYERLREFLQDQLQGQQQGDYMLTAVPGVISSQVSLLSGQSVPVISPYLPGLSNWSSSALVKDILGSRPSQSGSEQNIYDAKAKTITGYLQRMYYSLLNLGITPQDRAKNFSATNLVPMHQMVTDLNTGETSENRNITIDTITVEKSTISPPNTDCWDVKIILFDPSNLAQARKVMLFTIDVSYVMPVSIDVVRSWPIY